MIYSSFCEDDCNTIKFKIGKQEVRAILDSGAIRSLIRPEVLKGSNKIQSSNIVLSDVQGNRISVLGEIELELKFNKRLILEHEFIVTDSGVFNADILLGLDFMRKHQVTLCWEENIMWLYGHPVYMINNNSTVEYTDDLETNTLQISPVYRPKENNKKSKCCSFTELSNKVDADRPKSINPVTNNNHRDFRAVVDKTLKITKTNDVRKKALSLVDNKMKNDVNNESSNITKTNDVRKRALSLADSTMKNDVINSSSRISKTKPPWLRLDKKMTKDVKNRGEENFQVKF